MKRRPIYLTPLEYHPPIDNACESCDTEDIPYGCSNWTSQLIKDMETRDIIYLERHYPELVFARVLGRKGKSRWLAPLGYDYLVELGRGWWKAARWRTAP